MHKLPLLPRLPRKTLSNFSKATAKLWTAVQGQEHLTIPQAPQREDQKGKIRHHTLGKKNKKGTHLQCAE